MCILIVKPAGKYITKEALQRCFSSNPDGAGFAYVNTDNLGVTKVKVRKAMTFTKFYIQYERAVREAPLSNMVIHFRIRTSGTIEEYNNHPFKVDNNMVIAHNGIINKMNGKLEGRENDTRAFIRLILRTLPKGWQNSPGCLAMIEEYIGWSKLATLDNNNKVIIMNESKGAWDDGVWYSNKSYMPVMVRASYQDGVNQDTYQSDLVWSWLMRKQIKRADAVWNRNTKDWELATVASSNVYPIVKKEDTGNILGIEDIVPSEVVAELYPDWCEYCETYKTGETYKRYRTSGLEMIYCEGCASLLENASVLEPHTLVSQRVALNA